MRKGYWRRRSRRPVAEPIRPPALGAGQTDLRPTGIRSSRSRPRNNLGPSGPGEIRAHGSRSRQAIGLVASLARPGGNVTGLSMGSADVVGKRLELLREVVPGLRPLAIMANAGYSATVLEMNEVKNAAR